MTAVPHRLRTSAELDVGVSRLISSTPHTTSRPTPSVHPSPDDLWIAMMGVTGAGKSSFISLFVDQEIDIGHGLYSATKHVNIFRYNPPEDRTVWLVDTPGFNDTERSDVETLEEIATYFVKLFEKGVQFSAVIYLHRITDPKMSGTAVKNLELLKLIVGPNSFQTIRLVTTRWDEVIESKTDHDSCVERERQLASCDEFFKPILDGGALLLRHEGFSQTTGKEIMNSIIRNKQRTTIQIQDEMFNRDAVLGQTSAGLYLGREHAALQKSYDQELQDIQENLTAAIQERDEEMLTILRSEQCQFQNRRERLFRDRKYLSASFRDLNTKKVQELRSDRHNAADKPKDALSGYNDQSNCEFGSSQQQRVEPFALDAGLPPPGFEQEKKHSRWSKARKVRRQVTTVLQRGTLRGLEDERRNPFKEVQLWLWDAAGELHRAASKRF